MKKLILVTLCCVMGASWAEGLADRIKARAKCRRILVRSQEVVVKFTCEEDARLFAEDFKKFVGD